MKTKLTRSLIHLSILTALINSPAGAEECRTAEGGRIETQAALDALRDVCELTVSLGVFPIEPVIVDLPNLKRAPLINIDSDKVENIFLPALESTRILHIKGRIIKNLELPNLRTVSRAIYILSTGLINIDFTGLQSAGHIMINGNPELEEVFTPFVSNFMQVSLNNNPAMAAETATMLKSLESPDGPATLAAERAATEEAGMMRIEAARRYHDRAIAPTGHPTYFGTIGFYNYGNQYHRYRYPRYVRYYPRLLPCFNLPYGYCYY